MESWATNVIAQTENFRLFGLMEVTKSALIESRINVDGGTE